MTTNNHPAHGPLSLERLHQISEILSKAAAQSDGGSLGHAMADAVKVIAGVIASFGAEPVAIVEPSDYVTAAQLVGEEPRSKAVRPLFEGALAIGMELYTAPPAPAVPDEMYWQDAPVEGSTRAAAYATGWNACRSAMLKGDEK